MPSKKDWVNFALQRPNYFAGQYLLDEDFELAHRYLNDRQKYLNSHLHLAGIVEGLEVEAIVGQPEVIIKSGTAIDGEGNLIILTEAVTRKINSLGWLCLRYHQEPKILQQPEILDSYTRFEETPIITLEAIQSNDAITITLAKVLLQHDQVIIDASVRQYSGVRLPSAKQDIELRSDGQDLSIQGNLTVSGALQLGGTLIQEISQSIPAIDRPNVIPSEKAVKDHIAAALSNAGKPTGEAPAVRLDQKDGKMVGWKIKGSEDANDPTASLRLLASENGVEKPRLSIERDTGLVIVHETLRAKHLEVINPMRHRMYPAGSTDPQNPTIYDDIFEAEKAGVIVKSDDLPKNSYDRTNWSAKGSYFWREAICYGKGKEDKGGAIITLPSGYDTAWVRIGNTNEWHVVNAQFSTDGKIFRDLGNWTAGKRNGNCYCPDGSLGDSSRPYHQWLPIPVGQSGLVKLIHKCDQSWLMLSGVAFSKNPWGHAAQSALGYHWADRVNQGDAAMWDNDNWNGDILAYFDNLMTYEIRVPVVPSGRDKLLYLINHNDYWNGVLHTGLSIKIGDTYQPIERFLATYDNPFARHWSSRFYNRYIAARIPADMITKALNLTNSNDRMTQLISIKVDLTKQGEEKNNFEDKIFFREIGTHDLELPYYL
ncbi:hypothetical protein [Pseudanabaena sp. UWO310]|uniref:hypothetical protein n=1 Tax=Pseudanabaena sp. UWO310 TaxID=2480795 RepID=UPI001157FB20|nr:hypothetical protein [Pseudanabaena sp. UWO310]TYQ31001.1 hypothetical protein PseudUWO310_05855 [Pseudanabaena sp. UWO310]